MTACGSCEKCNLETRWVCRKEGNFYSTGEYSRTLEFFDIHGVSFNQRVESVKMQLDPNTLQILKVLLTDNDAPIKFDSFTDLQIVELLDIIQSKLSEDNSSNTMSFNSPKTEGGDDE